MKFAIYKIPSLLVFAFICLSVCASDMKPLSFAESAAEANPLSWTWKDGDVFSHGRNGILAADGAPVVSRLVMTAKITPGKYPADKWSTAGIALNLDEDNSWRLSLVRAPDREGARHAFELAEKRGGKWLANLNDKLASRDVKTYRKWNDGETYLFKLTLDGECVAGEIRAMDGSPVYTARFFFKHEDGTAAEAVREGQPSLHASGAFHVKFSGFMAEWSEVRPAPQKKELVFPAYSRAADIPEIKSKATGFFRLEQIGDDGRWWVIDPNGCAAIVRGMDHIRYEGHWCEAENRHPHLEFNKKLFPDKADWENNALRLMEKWGFNMLGSGCDRKLMYRGLIHTRFLSVGDGMCIKMDKEYYICPHENKPCSAFPNVFHPKFEEWCDYVARTRCAPYKNDPWLFGYFLDNELAWWGRGSQDTGLFDEVMKLDDSHSAKIALREFLKERGVKGEASKKDKHAFLRLAAERYFSVSTAAIRRYDPNHLILGSRFAGLNGADPVVWEVSGRYCDIVTFNCYPWADLDRNEVRENSSPSARSIVRAFDEQFSIVKRPMLVTEWSFPALDSGLPCLRGAGQRFYTQKERVAATELFAKTMLSLPYFIGYDYFMWVDEPERGISKAFPEDTNYGLLAENGTPYPEITEMFTEFHRNIGKWHLSPVPTVNESVPVWRGVKAAQAMRALPNGGNVLFEETADGVYRMKNAAGLVLEGKIGDRNFLSSVKLGDVNLGTYSGMLNFNVSENKETWRMMDKVTSAGFKTVGEYGVLTLEGESCHEYGSYRMTQFIIVSGSSPYYLSVLKEIENIGEKPLDVKRIFFLQFPSFAVTDKFPRPMPPLWRRPMKDAWIDGKSGVWVGGATSCAAVRSFSYFIFGDKSMHPDAIFIPKDETVLQPGESYLPNGDMWMYGLGGTGGNAAWEKSSAAALSSVAGE